MARSIKMNGAIDFLLKRSGVEWKEAHLEEYGGIFISPALSRSEIFDLALCIPEKLFIQDRVGIINSSNSKFCIMLDVNHVIKAWEDPFSFLSTFNQNEQVQPTVNWEQRSKVVVSQQMSQHEAIRLAREIDQDLFFSEGVDAIGIVKSSGNGFRVLLDPVKFKATEHILKKTTKLRCG